MEQKFIKTIDDLRLTVKVNASFPFASLEPYLDDAYAKYMLPYLGEKLSVRLCENDNPSTEDIYAKTVAMRALGPLSVAMAMPELGVMISDSGHKVSRDDKYTVANDNKILEAEQSMQERGWANVERLLGYLSENLSKFVEWKESRYYKNLSEGHYLNSSREFQDYGMVNIGYSRLAFEQFRPLISVFETKLNSFIGKDLNKSLLSLNGTADPVKNGLIALIREWIAMNVAKLYTSQTTRVQRTAAGTVEFSPMIYPLYSDQDSNGNFYAEQVASIESSILDYMAENAVGLGIEAPVVSDFNSIDKHIFVL